MEGRAMVSQAALDAARLRLDAAGPRLDAARLRIVGSGH
jgi:hypothetical protein